MGEFTQLRSKVPVPSTLTAVSVGCPEDDHIHWQGMLYGDVAAFERLMLSQYRALFHYGLKFSSDQGFVRDCIQDLFLHIWERRENLNADIPPKPYLMASLRRMMNRAAEKLPQVLDSQSESPNHPLIRIEFSVEKKYIQRESARLLSEQLKTILDALPIRQKEVIYLKYYQELSRSQIAMVMDIEPQTVSNLLQMALKKLRKHWEAEFTMPLA